MKPLLKCFGLSALLFAVGVRAQGTLIHDGVVTNQFPGEIDVWNPGTQVTGFIFTPAGKQQPTFYTNVFHFDEPLSIGVRVFRVSENDPISLQLIAAMAYPELLYPADYVFQADIPFLVGLYTGANITSPSQPYFYTDPVFGWARLVNNQGHIQLLDSALAYQAQGIFAGTENFVPEPRVLGIAVMGTLLFGFHRWQKRSN